MSTENDNLPQADGQNEGQINSENLNTGAENNVSENETIDTQNEVKNTAELADSTPVEEPKTEETPEAKAEEKDFDQNADKAEIEEEKEEEVKVPVKNYESFSFEQLIEEASQLLNAYPAVKLKDAFNGLRDTFRQKSAEIEAKAKEKFLADGGNEIDFRHDNPHGTKFFDIFAVYRRKVEEYYKAEEAKQAESLKEREAIIDDLKALYTEPSDNNSQIFKKFRDLKTRWHNAGRVPKADAGNIFKTYYFHLDNFNEFLDMNQELRVMDYEHNLEVRKSIIGRAKALLGEDNVQKALNELQYLHKMWKEEGVPVAEEFRETTWQEFKDITSKIHDRKIELNEQIQKQQAENLAIKHNIIAKIKGLLSGEEKPKSHNAWQRKIKEMNTLRDQFFNTGRVPREDNQPTWDKFKEASRIFNHEKNVFYKDMKSEQMENLEKKRKLVEIANEHKDSTNWNESVNVVKRIQSEWRKIGHVPRKYSDKIWKEFSDANNQFFDRYKNRNNEKLERQQQNLEEKIAFLKEMEAAEKPANADDLILWINEKSVAWSSIGFVPNGKQEINKEFSVLSGKILQSAGLDKNAVEKAQWEAQIDQIKTNLDEKLLKNMKFDLRKRMDDTQAEVTQLQTNLAFFSNADDSNPLFKNAIQNIESKVAELDALKKKYSDLRKINLEALAEAQKAKEEAQAESEANSEEE